MDRQNQNGKIFRGSPEERLDDSAPFNTEGLRVKTEIISLISGFSLMEQNVIIQDVVVAILDNRQKLWEEAQNAKVRLEGTCMEIEEAVQLLTSTLNGKPIPREFGK